MKIDASKDGGGAPAPKPTNAMGTEAKGGEEKHGGNVQKAATQWSGMGKLSYVKAARGGGLRPGTNLTKLPEPKSGESKQNEAEGGWKQPKKSTPMKEQKVEKTNYASTNAYTVLDSDDDTPVDATSREETKPNQPRKPDDEKAEAKNQGDKKEEAWQNREKANPKQKEVQKNNQKHGRKEAAGKSKPEKGTENTNPKEEEVRQETKGAKEWEKDEEEVAEAMEANLAITAAKQGREEVVPLNEEEIQYVATILPTDAQVELMERETLTYEEAKGKMGRINAITTVISKATTVLMKDKALPKGSTYQDVASFMIEQSSDTIDSINRGKWDRYGILRRMREHKSRALDPYKMSVKSLIDLLDDKIKAKLLASDFNLSQKEAKKAIKKIVERVYLEWTTQAKAEIDAMTMQELKDCIYEEGALHALLKSKNELIQFNPPRVLAENYVRGIIRRGVANNPYDANDTRPMYTQSVYGLPMHIDLSKYIGAKPLRFNGPNAVPILQMIEESKFYYEMKIRASPVIGVETRPNGGGTEIRMHSRERHELTAYCELIQDYVNAEFKRSNTVFRGTESGPKLEGEVRIDPAKFLQLDRKQYTKENASGKRGFILGRLPRLLRAMNYPQEDLPFLQAKFSQLEANDLIAAVSTADNIRKALASFDRPPPQFKYGNSGGIRSGSNTKDEVTIMIRNRDKTPFEAPPQDIGLEYYKKAEAMIDEADHEIQLIGMDRGDGSKRPITDVRGKNPTPEEMGQFIFGIETEKPRFKGEANTGRVVSFQMTVVTSFHDFANPSQHAVRLQGRKADQFRGYVNRVGLTNFALEKKPSGFTPVLWYYNSHMFADTDLYKHELIENLRAVTGIEADPGTFRMGYSMIRVGSEGTGAIAMIAESANHELLRRQFGSLPSSEEAVASYATGAIPVAYDNEEERKALEETVKAHNEALNNRISIFIRGIPTDVDLFRLVPESSLMQDRPGVNDKSVGWLMMHGSQVIGDELIDSPVTGLVRLTSNKYRVTSILGLEDILVKWTQSFIDNNLRPYVSSMKSVLNVSLDVSRLPEHDPAVEPQAVRPPPYYAYLLEKEETTESAEADEEFGSAEDTAFDEELGTADLPYVTPTKQKEEGRAVDPTPQDGPEQSISNADKSDQSQKERLLREAAEGTESNASSQVNPVKLTAKAHQPDSIDLKDNEEQSESEAIDLKCDGQASYYHQDEQKRIAELEEIIASQAKRIEEKEEKAAQLEERLQEQDTAVAAAQTEIENLKTQVTEIRKAAKADQVDVRSVDTVPTHLVTAVSSAVSSQVTEQFTEFTSTTAALFEKFMKGIAELQAKNAEMMSEVQDRHDARVDKQIEVQQMQQQMLSDQHERHSGEMVLRREMHNARWNEWNGTVRDAMKTFPAIMEGNLRIFEGQQVMAENANEIALQTIYVARQNIDTLNCALSMISGESTKEEMKEAMRQQKEFYDEMDKDFSDRYQERTSALIESRRVLMRNLDEEDEIRGGTWPNRSTGPGHSPSTGPGHSPRGVSAGVDGEEPAESQRPPDSSPSSNQSQKKLEQANEELRSMENKLKSQERIHEQLARETRWATDALKREQDVNETLRARARTLEEQLSRQGGESDQQERSESEESANSRRVKASIALGFAAHKYFDAPDANAELVEALNSGKKLNLARLTEVLEANVEGAAEAHEFLQALKTSNQLGPMDMGTGESTVAADGGNDREISQNQKNEINQSAAEEEEERESERPNEEMPHSKTSTKSVRFMETAMKEDERRDIERAIANSIADQAKGGASTQPSRTSTPFKPVTPSTARVNTPTIDKIVVETVDSEEEDNDLAPRKLWNATPSRPEIKSKQRATDLRMEGKLTAPSMDDQWEEGQTAKWAAEDAAAWAITKEAWANEAMAKKQSAEGEQNAMEQGTKCDEEVDFGHHDSDANNFLDDVGKDTPGSAASDSLKRAVANAEWSLAAATQYALASPIASARADNMADSDSDPDSSDEEETEKCSECKSRDPAMKLYPCTNGQDNCTNRMHATCSSVDPTENEGVKCSKCSRLAKAGEASDSSTAEESTTSGDRTKLQDSLPDAHESSDESQHEPDEDYEQPGFSSRLRRRHKASPSTTPKSQAKGKKRKTPTTKKKKVIAPTSPIYKTSPSRRSKRIQQQK